MKFLMLFSVGKGAVDFMFRVGTGSLGTGAVKFLMSFSVGTGAVDFMF